MTGYCDLTSILVKIAEELRIKEFICLKFLENRFIVLPNYTKLILYLIPTNNSLILLLEQLCHAMIIPKLFHQSLMLSRGEIK